MLHRMIGAIGEAIVSMSAALIIKIEGKGGQLMMAMLFAQRIILGKNTFADVPAKLKEGVAEVLLESGLPELVPSNYGGTAPAEE